MLGNVGEWTLDQYNENFIARQQMVLLNFFARAHHQTPAGSTWRHVSG